MQNFLKIFWSKLSEEKTFEYNKLDDGIKSCNVESYNHLEKMLLIVSNSGLDEDAFFVG